MRWCLFSWRFPFQFSFLESKTRRDGRVGLSSVWLSSSVAFGERALDGGSERGLWAKLGPPSPVCLGQHNGEIDRLRHVEVPLTQHLAVTHGLIVRLFLHAFSSSRPSSRISRATDCRAMS